VYINDYIGLLDVIFVAHESESLVLTTVLLPLMCFCVYRELFYYKDSFLFILCLYLYCALMCFCRVYAIMSGVGVTLHCVS